MQTTQWGPEGWIFFHSIPFYYAITNPRPKQKDQVKEFYTLLKDILPCKYCRQSYEKFLEEVPIYDYLDGFILLFTWTYIMHNLVNKKLRDQGYLDEPDPDLANVLENYDKFCVPPNKSYKRWHLDPEEWLSPMLNFIATIVFNYDEKEPVKITGYKRLFEIWPHLMAGPEMKVLRNIIKENKPDLRSQDSLIKWYYNVVKTLINTLDKNYINLDQDYASYNTYFDKFQNRRAKCKQKSCRILKHA